MKESYGEGLARRTGHKSCVSNRKVARGALTVVQAGRVWSREMDRNQSADAVLSAEGHTDRCESASIGRTQRGRRPCMLGNSTRE